MITSLALIFLVGLALAGIFQKIKVPRLVGYILTGIILGPYVLDFLDPKILSISPELRQIALVIILIQAGLSLKISDLKKVGRLAILMTFVPAMFEIVGYVIFAPMFLDVNLIEAALMGSVLAAVSPAVVVPKMLQLMDEKYGTNKNIPQVSLAGSSGDDIFVIVLFSTFLNMAQGKDVNLLSLLDIPISVATGICFGLIFGIILYVLFEFSYRHNELIRNSMKVIIILAFSFLLLSIEDWAKGVVSISGLLGVIAMSMYIRRKMNTEVADRLSEKFSKLWLAAGVILFVMVGATVDINYMLKAGGKAILVIFLALLVRSVGVLVCLIGTNFNWKEKLYTIIAYVPKATVQAAIGSIPLSMGLDCGPIILSVAVLSIILTAPLGAFGMDMTYKKLLTQEKSPEDKKAISADKVKA